MRLGRLLLRATVGGFFVGHGTQKLLGSFGGEGLKATSEDYERVGLKPGNIQAAAAGAAETAGGAGLLLGWQTPLAAGALISSMATAINRVHLKNGPWASDGGFEYNAVIIAAAATLAEIGPGPLSIDGIRGKARSGAKWSLFALATGAGGAAALHMLAESKADAPAAPGPETDVPAAEPTTAVEDAPVEETIVEADIEVVEPAEAEETVED